MRTYWYGCQNGMCGLLVDCLLVRHTGHGRRTSRTVDRGDHSLYSDQSVWIHDNMMHLIALFNSVKRTIILQFCIKSIVHNIRLKFYSQYSQILHPKRAREKLFYQKCFSKDKNFSVKRIIHF